MWLQSLIVFIVVACCAAFVARSMLRKVVGTSAGCGGCGGCAQKNPKACAQPVVFHPPKRPAL